MSIVWASLGKKYWKLLLTTMPTIKIVFTIILIRFK